MDSLDAAPSAEYASLLTLSLQNDTSQQGTQFSAFDRNQNLSKENQEHIYAQVTSNGHANPIPQISDASKSDAIVENQSNIMPNKTFTKNSSLIRDSAIAVGHSTSVPNVRNTYSNLLGFCQNNYGSLTVTKEKDNAFYNTESVVDPSVFSISGRRVVVSNGYNGNVNNNKQLNGVKEPVVSSNHQNE